MGESENSKFYIEKCSEISSTSADVSLQKLEANTPITSPPTSWPSRIKKLLPKPHLSRINFPPIPLSKFRLPTALFIGACITAGTTYALVKHVQHLLATASVSSDPQIWLQQARTDGYEACYNGCNDCSDINWSYNRCQLTAQVIVPGVNCSGWLMWNWLDRYPTACLQALGEIYKAEALVRLKKSYRNQLALIILTTLAGVVGAWGIYKWIWPCWFPVKVAAPAWPRSSSTYPYHDTSIPTRPKRQRRKKGFFSWRTNRAVATAATFSILSTHPANAYICYDAAPATDQYFTNTATNLSGVIHGWVSNCHQEEIPCGETCTGGGGGGSSLTGGGAGTAQTCTPDFCPIDVMDHPPGYFVNQTAPQVQDCGFELVDNVEEEVSLLRVGNPFIEINRWVKISVNLFNLTDETHESVWCLYDIGNVKDWW